MEKIIKHRGQLFNYFFNQSKEYSKVEMLNKEYAALSFSPREEYIDSIITPFEEFITDFDDIENTTDEVYVKGIIVDIDNKKGYSIIHIQNKNNNRSISCSEQVVRYYSQYFEVGHVILACCHSFNDKLYMHFLIDYSTDDSFIMEENYINGVTQEQFDNIDPNKYHNEIALVRQATYFTSKKGTKCLRLLVYQNGENKTVISCFNLPNEIITGMFVEYQISSESFVNNVRRIRL